MFAPRSIPISETIAGDPFRGWDVQPVYGHTEKVRDTLSEIAKSPESTGYSDVGIRNLIYTTVCNLRPRRVLEIGTHIGTASIVIGEALQRNGYGRLLTLEPFERYRALATANIKQAGVSDLVEIVPNFSHDEECKSRLQNKAPFEVIYIDGSHDYDDVIHDIGLCANLLADNGIMILHDVGPISDELDATNKGGPRRALLDFCEKSPQFVPTLFEFPLWLNHCGASMVWKRPI